MSNDEFEMSLEEIDEFKSNLRQVNYEIEEEHIEERLKCRMENFIRDSGLKDKNVNELFHEYCKKNFFDVFSKAFQAVKENPELEGKDEFDGIMEEAARGGEDLEEDNKDEQDEAI